MTVQVTLNLLPVPGVVADLVAPRTDGNEATERLDLRQRVLQFQDERGILPGDAPPFGDDGGKQQH